MLDGIEVLFFLFVLLPPFLAFPRFPLPLVLEKIQRRFRLLWHTDKKLLTVACALELEVAKQTVILFKVFVKVTVLNLTNNSFLGELVERILGGDSILGFEAFGLGSPARTGCA